MAIVGQVRVNFLADTAQFGAGVKRAGSLMVGFGRAIDKVASGGVSTVARLTKGFFSLNTAIVGALTGFAAYKFVDALDAAAQEIDKIGKAGKRLGITVEELSALRFAASESGLEFETLAKAASKALQAMSREAEKGAAWVHVGRLNIQLRDTNGNVRSLTELLPDLARGIESAGSQADQLQLAQKFFGREGGDQFVTLLRESGGFIENLAVQTERARRLGVIFTEDQVTKLTAYRDAIGRVKEAWLGLRVKLATEVAPVLADLANKAAAALASVPEVIQKITRLIRDALGARGDDMENAAVEKISLIFGAATDTAIAGAELLLRVVGATVIDGVRLLPDLAGPAVTAAFVEIFMSAAAEAQKKLASYVKDFAPDFAAEMVRRADAGMAEARANLRVSTNEDFDAAFKKLGTGTLVLDQWRKGIEGVKDEGGKLIAILDRVFGIGDIFAQHLVDEIDVLPGKLKDAADKVDLLAQRFTEFRNDAGLAIVSWGKQVSDQFADLVVDGKASFDQLLKSWIKTLVSMASQKFVFGPLFSALGSEFAGRDLSAPSASQGAPTPGAHGFATSGGRVAAFGRGGVANGPTYFPLRTGLIGEAGRPEGYFPLTRIGGDLAVKGATPQVTVQVIDQRSGGARPEITQDRGADGRLVIRAVIRDEVKGMIGDGSLDRQASQAWGVKRRAVPRG